MSANSSPAMAMKGGDAPSALPSSNTAGANESLSFTRGNKEKPRQVRTSNIAAAVAVADVIRTSLGPRGLDKMIQLGDAKKTVVVTNDGATILRHLPLLHPAASMMAKLSEAQETAVGDGTTTVVVLAGALLQQAERLLTQRDVSPLVIAEGFRMASKQCLERIRLSSLPVDVTSVDDLQRCALTALHSKVVSSSGAHIAAVAAKATKLNPNPKVIKILGGMIEETALLPGVLLRKADGGRLIRSATVKRCDKARVAIVQFALSPPKTDLDMSIVVSDYQQMDRILREERTYVLDMCKRLKKSNIGCVVVQKSILKDSVHELARHYLEKLKIVVVEDVDRDDISWLCGQLGVRPLADLSALDHADRHEHDFYAGVEAVDQPDNLDGAVQFHLAPAKKDVSPVTIVVRGSNQVVLEEAERSLQDALGVLRSLRAEPRMVCGGGAVESSCAARLRDVAPDQGAYRLPFEAFAEALEVIPGVLSENAGLFPLAIVDELRSLNNASSPAGKSTSASPATADVAVWGVSVRRAAVGDMREEGVMQPALVTQSAISLATETVCQLLKIDDIVEGR